MIIEERDREKEKRFRFKRHLSNNSMSLASIRYIEMSLSTDKNFHCLSIDTFIFVKNLRRTIVSKLLIETEFFNIDCTVDKLDIVKH